MSIWCSWPHIGHFEHEPPRGDVRAYREGFSNHFPDDSDGDAMVDIAHIPSWCVPGHDEDADNFGQWVRLSITSPSALSWWTRVDGQPTAAPVYGSVVLDVEAAQALVNDLTSWIGRATAIAKCDGEGRGA